MVVDAAERVELARRILAQAERRTGARSVRTEQTTAPQPMALTTTSVPTMALPTTTLPTTTLPATTLPTTTLPAMPAQEKFQQAVPTPRTALLTTERPPLPVPVELESLLPDGLRRGATTAVTGSTSLVLALLGAACSGGAWAAVVGQPSLGLLAAAQAGVGLERLAVVPAPGADVARVLGALVDGMDVVVVGPAARLTDADRRRLSGRARERGAVLLATAAWPGADVVLTAEGGRWTGIGAGEGRLRSHELRVVRSGRGSAAGPAALELTLPLSGVRSGGGGGVRPATGARSGPLAVAEPVGLRLVG